MKKKLFWFSNLILFACGSLFADSNISSGSGISVLDNSLNKIFNILKGVGIAIIILAIVICGLMWAIPYLIQKEDARNNENLMKLTIKIGIASLVVGLCLFAPSQIYSAIFPDAQNSNSDYLIYIKEIPSKNELKLEEKDLKVKLDDYLIDLPESELKIEKEI